MPPHASLLEYLKCRPLSPASSLFLHSHTHTLSLSLAFVCVHQYCTVTPNRRTNAASLCAKGNGGDRVTIAMACVDHGLGLGLESTFEMYDALCI